MAYSMTLKLTASQLEERRHQLDRAGFHAWLSSIILLVVVYLYRRLFHSLLLSSKSPLSPSGSQQVSQLQLFLRRAAWVLRVTYIPEFGPLSVQLVALVYTGWLLSLTLRHTGDDYMHLTKAFGHVAISQLPMHYLLSLKHTTYSPLEWATGLTHERLNSVHRIFGRLVHAFLAAHAILYLRFFVKMGLLPKRIKDLDVRLGILAFWMFNFLGLLSLPMVRRKMYHVIFYRGHVLLSALVIPVLWAHVPYTRFYVAQVAAIWILGGLLRRSGLTNVEDIQCENLPGTQLVRVRLLVDKKSSLASAAPGQHVYIRRRKGGVMTGPKTPFSIANVQPSAGQDGKAETVEVMLVLRNMGGPGTSFLVAAAASKKPRLKDAARDEIQIEGPYGEASVYMPSILGSDATNPVLLVAGGIGATYVLPIYLALLASRRRRRRGGRQLIKMVWLVKTLADAQWGLEFLASRSREGLELDVDIYITLSSSTDGPDIPTTSSSLPSLLKNKGLNIHQLGHRPNLAPIIDEVFLASSSSSSSSSSPGSLALPDPDPEEVTVFVCGPRGLSSAVRGIVGRRVISEGRRVSWFEEVFGFGGR
ncbi:uncharacterized protein Z519_02692 [Cladophialophora bantiana CBS 173.52]|uniref:FAD-binding FR-type domain-containing protein n=1 Tax=Cladophialophora bantiana (strain ATCC 10958 / CBS 173.52 / CDC B-1940 / NIH 8579) TaxID=1442370 RepID=A0A0D2I267_CLAB1|nr:uncharacterized protein Z519_02692 [Cladophialophora bantiana CBS 173.52]KIW97300.1 hypothetical protein Z519_02692 [Cladophialophora bantiana CBS 173.52]